MSTGYLVLWRIADSDDTDELARFFEKVQRSSSSLTLGKLGKLHRDSKDFHRHGTARNQGFPNHFVTAGDLDGMKKATCDEGSYHEHLDHISQPVALFCSNDTIDANFVLAPPQLVSVQNYCAIKNFKELGESPTGLWSSINQASFVILADKASKAAPSSVRKTAKSDSSNSKLVTAQQEHNDHLHSLERESEWVDLRRQMESVLGIQPRQNQYLESTSLVLPAKQQDTLPSNEQ
uniref:Uncharacterized protein n=1 Tax=Globisporangium ultimum (strain ATCC 200006 / CBS 805.95 / DAOM BR144) TaxID=431595 RepID=K3XAB9_GLOUD